MSTHLPPSENPGDRRLHEALRQLPDLEAPASLLPGVLAAIRAREDGNASWYRRPVATWSPALRVAFGVGALSIIGALALAGQLLWPAGDSIASGGTIAKYSAALGGLIDAVQALVGACGTALSHAPTPVLLVVGAVLVFSYLTLLGLGGIAWRAATYHDRT